MVDSHELGSHPYYAIYRPSFQASVGVPNSSTPTESIFPSTKIVAGNEQMSDQSPHELLYTVNRRWDCLQAIVEEPQEKRELVETLSMPRSTLDTVVRELEGADLVSYHNGVWQPTVAGEATAEVYADSVGSIRSIHAAGQVLSPLSGDHELPTAVLEGADSYPTKESVPDAVLTEFLDRVADADRIRGVAPRALSGYTDRVFRTAATNDTTLEMTLADSVFAQLSSIDPETVADRLQRELFSVYSAPVDAEFGFWIGTDPDHVGLIVYADRGIHGIVVNDTREAVEWATDRYASIHREAEEVTPADVPTAENEPV